MNVRIAALAALMSLACSAAMADPPVSPTVVTGTNANGGPTYSGVGNGAAGSVPMPVAGGGETVLGYQQISSSTLASATNPTIPAGTTHIDIYPEGTNGTNGQCIRYRDDGSSPTASVGLGLASQQDILGWTGSLTNLQFIAASAATCGLNLRYWK